MPPLWCCLTESGSDDLLSGWSNAVEKGKLPSSMIFYYVSLATRPGKIWSSDDIYESLCPETRSTCFMTVECCSVEVWSETGQMELPSKRLWLDVGHSCKRRVRQLLHYREQTWGQSIRSFSYGRHTLPKLCLGLDPDTPNVYLVPLKITEDSIQIAQMSERSTSCCSNEPGLTVPSTLGMPW